jgi:hypothetical protein
MNEVIYYCYILVCLDHDKCMHVKAMLVIDTRINRDMLTSHPNYTMIADSIKVMNLERHKWEACRSGCWV